MQQEQNPDVNSIPEKDKNEENIPLPPTEDVPAPIEEPPSEDKPPIKDDRDHPKKIV